MKSSKKLNQKSEKKQLPCIFTLKMKIKKKKIEVLW